MPEHPRGRFDDRSDPLPLGTETLFSAPALGVEVRRTGVRPGRFDDRSDALVAPSDPAFLSGMARAAGQGFFALGDEVEAATRALVQERETGESFGDAYARHVEDARAGLETFRAEFPKTALATELGASVAIPGGAVLGAARAVPAVARGVSSLRTATTVGQAMRRGAGAGAGAGAAFGAGSGEDLGDRALRGAGGALFGGAIGGAIPPVFASGRALLNHFRPSAGTTREIERALQRDFPDLTPEQAADRVTQNLAALRKGNPEAVLADAAGENMRSFLRRAEAIPGPGRQIVMSRIEGRDARQFQRIASGLRRGTGIPAKRSADIVTDQMAKRARAAAPLYRDAYAQPLSSEALEHLAEIQATPIGRRALARSRSLMASEATSPAGQGFRGVKWKDVPPVARADALKRGLDGLTRGARDPNERRVMSGLAREIRDLVDEDLAGPDGISIYAQARQAFGEPARYLDAIETGAKAVDGSFDDLVTAMGKATQAEAEALRLGFVNKVVEKMRRERTDLPNMLKFVRSRDMQDKIATIMPTDGARQQWKLLMAAEVAARRSSETIKGSRTAIVEADKAAAERAADVWQSLTSLIFLGGRDLVTKKVPGLARAANDRLVARQTAEIADIVTAPGGGVPALSGQTVARGGAAPGALAGGAAEQRAVR